MMHLRHAASQNIHRLTRRYPFLRRFSITTALLTLLWIYIIYWGERSVSASHIEACNWEKWEKWPREATPHHLVFIADPQLVDPHTYPGRPWPLSSLTESYTDQYMTRNFRLINERLDPDSIVFLGDLFDGGREWSTNRARPLKDSQKKKLEGLGILAEDKPKWKREDGETVEEDDGTETGNGRAKRSLSSYKKALMMPHDHHIEKKDHFLDARGNDLKEFVHGENGRWSKWDQRQWDADFVRFGRIFFDPSQLYPNADRQSFAAFEVASHPVNLDNGANDTTRQEYAVAGGKQRRILTSLPGNHDVGFGMGVQLAVKDRFNLRFGESNRIDVIGNHTFISLDTPSLSAAGQYMPMGGETPSNKAAELEHIWKPSMHFLENVRTPAKKTVSDALHDYYPDIHPARGYHHAVTDPDDHSNERSTDEVAKEDLSSRVQLPVILLSHVPLYRNPDTDCGALREKGHAISISAGYQYQNVITQSLSNNIINSVSAAGNIVGIFSGDDHDYCDISHRYNIAVGKIGPVLRSVREITVKSFSWAMGVRHPGFQLVSLWNPIDAEGKTVGTPLPTMQTHMCLLPDQLKIFIDYALLLGFTLVVLLVRAIFIGLRSESNADTDDIPESPLKLVLPRFQSRANGTANGLSTPTRQAKGRQRASSSSLSSKHTNDKSLSVQRSYNARTRSVSPANPSANLPYGLPNLQEHAGPLIEKAGFYPPVPQVRWSDPADDSDEEKSVGVGGGDGPEEEDSQAKWKRRRRTHGPAWRVVREFTTSVGMVGVPAGCWYWWLVASG